MIVDFQLDSLEETRRYCDATLQESLFLMVSVEGNTTYECKRLLDIKCPSKLVVRDLSKYEPIYEPLFHISGDMNHNHQVRIK